MKTTQSVAKEEIAHNADKPNIATSPFVSKLQGLKRTLILLKKCALIALNIWGLKKSKNPPGPIHAQIGIADQCNHNCVMCWDHPPEENISATTKRQFAHLPPGMMPFDQYKGIVDDLIKSETYRLELVGQGEPMLHDDVIAMVAYAKKKGMVVRMISNGSLIFEKEAKALVDHGMDHLQISLNAGKPTSYPFIHTTETPEDFVKVKSNLSYLSEYKKARQSQFPRVRLSFVISKNNCFELKEMIEVTHEVGAEEARFVYSSVHEGTQNIRLTEEDFHKTQSMIPEALELAKKLGVDTDLETLAASQPPYLEEVLGPKVVPCYIGWYFTRIGGNGSVHACCQCSGPLDLMQNVGRWRKLWGSEIYNRFRKASRALPEKSEMLKGYQCDQCIARPTNITIHNLLFPFSKIKGTKKNVSYKMKDISSRISKS